MRTRLQRLALLTVLSTTPLLGVAAPAQAGPGKAAGGQVDGPASFDEVKCPGPPPGFEAMNPVRRVVDDAMRLVRIQGTLFV